MFMCFRLDYFMIPHSLWVFFAISMRSYNQTHTCRKEQRGLSRCTWRRDMKYGTETWSQAGEAKQNKLSIAWMYHSWLCVYLHNKCVEREKKHSPEGQLHTHTHTLNRVHVCNWVFSPVIQAFNGVCVSLNSNMANKSWCSCCN